MNLALIERIIGDAANFGALIAIVISIIKFVFNPKRRYTLLPSLIILVLLAGTIFLSPYLAEMLRLTSNTSFDVDLALSALIITIVGLIFSDFQAVKQDNLVILIATFIAVDILLIVLILAHVIPGV